jgi:ATP-dependent DNA helicase DinG
MLNEAVQKSITDFYRAVQQGWPNFKPREGQLQMVAAIGNALSNAKSAEDKRNGDNLVVVQGKTGVGKTVGYAIPGIVVSKELKKRLLISTNSVALQEQIFEKDLPALAMISPIPFTYALAKGRGRYICNVKLESLTGHAMQKGMFDDASWDRPPEQHEISTLKTIAIKLDKKDWNGDKDSLDEDVTSELWGKIAADRHSCAGKHCPRFNSCSYYNARRDLVKADVIVANHNLVLSVLASESKLLPEPEDTLYIFDEAHELPDTAIAQFASEHHLNATIKFLEKLPMALNRCASLVPASDELLNNLEMVDVLVERLEDLKRLLDSYQSFADNSVWRFAHGALPEAIAGLAEDIEKISCSVFEMACQVQKAITEERNESHSKEPLNKAFQELGVYVPKLESLYTVWSQMMASENPPIAKWIERISTARGTDYLISSAPISAANALTNALWQRAAAVAMTSATIQTLGSFDYYLRNTGLNRFPKTLTVDVKSPFDYAKQGLFVVPKMKSSPTNAEAHTRELCDSIPSAILRVKLGALALFTSKKQMAAVYEALPDVIKRDVLVQGSMPKSTILSLHRQYVDNGKRSVIFGLASFGTGVDLPGQYCEFVLIAKLPFAPPDSPIEEARAEWMEKQNLNPFTEMSVPKAGLILNQWAGRLIRTELDHGCIVCFDNRLATKNYGKTLISGLPPYRQEICVYAY